MPTTSAPARPQYVIAENFKQYRIYISSHKLKDRREAVYVASPSHFAGMRDIEIVCTGTYTRRADAGEMLEMVEMLEACKCATVRYESLVSR